MTTRTVCDSSVQSTKLVQSILLDYAYNLLYHLTRPLCPKDVAFPLGIVYILSTELQIHLWKFSDVDCNCFE